MKIYFYDNAIRVTYPEGFEKSAIKFTKLAFKSLGLDVIFNDCDESNVKLLTFDNIAELDSAKFYMITYPFFKEENYEKNN